MKENKVQNLKKCRTISKNYRMTLKYRKIRKSVQKIKIDPQKQKHVRNDSRGKESGVGNECYKKKEITSIYLHVDDPNLNGQSRDT